MTECCKPLAYRLRNGVTCAQKSGAPLLVLDFPLKSILLKPSWKPVFEFLNSTKGYISLDEIIFHGNQTDPDKVEIFLNHLVCRGFLEQEGLSRLVDYPHVSIIIPVRNRPEDIASCLQSLREIDYPPEKVEIIVVDDASTDNSPDVVSRFPVTLIAIKEHKQASFCRNLAAERAQGEILAFIDSDCLADPLWLKELVPAFKDPLLGAVGGAVDSYFKEEGLDRYERVKSSLKVGFWFRRSREGENFFYVPSCNLVVKRDIFLELGGFKEDLHVGEDVDFCWRMQDGGYNLEYRPTGLIYHKHRNRLGAFARRRFDYGTSEPLLQQAHTDRIKKLIFPPAETFFWLAAILSVVFSSAPLLGLSALSLMAGSLFKFIRVRREGIPVGYPRVFAAVFRSYLAFVYHICAFVSRYYLIPAIIIFPFAPWVSAMIFGMHLIAGCVEFFTKKPELNPFAFLLFFTVEQLSYQLGVWWGCFGRWYFHPVNPKVVMTSATGKTV